MRTVLFIIKFLLLGAFFIISNQGLALIDDGQRDMFVNQYQNWISQVFNQVGVLTGYVVNIKWLPDLNDLGEKTEKIVQKTKIKYTDIRK